MIFQAAEVKAWILSLLTEITSVQEFAFHEKAEILACDSCKGKHLIIEEHAKFGKISAEINLLFSHRKTFRNT